MLFVVFWRTVALLLLISWCTAGPSTVCASHYNRSSLRVLWTYPSLISDFGYTFALDQARTTLDDRFTAEGLLLESNALENIVEQNCVEAVQRALLAQWRDEPYDLWVTTGSQHMDCANTILEDERFSDLKIVVTQPFATSERVAVTSAYSHELRYLQGALCALASKTGTVGFVAASPQTMRSVARPVAAFLIGARSVKPNIRVVLGTTGSFLFPLAERKATEILIKQAGADCIGSHQNDNTVQFVAHAHNISSVGYSSDARYFAGESVLVSALFHWEKVFEKVYEHILFDTWPNNFTLSQGLASDSVYLSAFSTLVDMEWQNHIREETEKFKNGELSVFCTPHFTDPTWMTTNNTEEVRPGIRCLTPTALSRLVGVLDGMEHLVAYNDSYTPYITKFVHWRDTSSIILITVSVLLIIIAIGSAIDVLIHLNHPVISASSPLFLFLILLGIVLMACPVFLRIGPRTKYNCMAVWWFTGIGHATVFACLFAKNWRIWRIFASPNMRKTIIFDTELVVKFVLLFIASEVLILAVWTGYSPQVPTILPIEDSDDQDELQHICAPMPGRRRGGLITYIIYNILLVIPLAFISYWTRIAKSEYKESRQMAVIVYATLVILLIIIGISFTSPASYSLEWYLTGYGLLMIPFIVWVCIFLPKHLRLRTSPKSRRTTDSTLSSAISQPIFESAVQPPTMDTMDQNVVEVSRETVIRTNEEDSTETESSDDSQL